MKPLPAWHYKVSWFTQHTNKAFTREFEMAVREEFSTCDWIMEGLLTRAGFTIELAEYPEGMLARYWCRKGSVDNTTNRR